MLERGISPRLHGVLDYTTGAVLLAAPKVLGLEGKPAGAVLRAAGAGHVGYSLLTAYELGVVKLLPYRGHLAVDAVAASGLLAAPLIAGRARRRSRWPFGARRTARAEWLPHAVFGVWELAAVALSVPGVRGPVDAPATGGGLPSPVAPSEEAAAGGTSTTDPTVTVMPEGADVALADRGAAARRGTGGGVGSGTGPGSNPDVGGLQS